MIYTIGVTTYYEDYFNRDIFWGPNGVPQKARGGSVWKTKKAAAKFCSEDCSIYGVEANWKTDTQLTVDCWNELLVDSDLVKL